MLNGEEFLVVCTSNRIGKIQTGIQRFLVESTCDLSPLGTTWSLCKSGNGNHTKSFFSIVSRQKKTIKELGKEEDFEISWTSKHWILGGLNIKQKKEMAARLNTTKHYDARGSTACEHATRPFQSRRVAPWRPRRKKGNRRERAHPLQNNIFLFIKKKEKSENKTMINEWMHYLPTALCAPPISCHRKFLAIRSIHERTAVSGVDRPRKQSSMMSTGGCRFAYITTNDVKVFFLSLFLLKASTLSRHQRHPFFVGRNNRTEFSFRLLDIWVTGLANNLFMTSYTLVRTWLHRRMHFFPFTRKCLKGISKSF
jgi:hypothetical protein